MCCIYAIGIFFSKWCLFFNFFFFFKINSSVELTWPCLIKSFFLFSHSACFFRRWLPWLWWELWISTLWRSPHGSTNERAWWKKLRARLRTPSPSSWRVWWPCWVSCCHVVWIGSSEDECRPGLQYLLSLWQCRAGQYLTADVSISAGEGNWQFLQHLTFWAAGKPGCMYR